MAKKSFDIGRTPRKAVKEPEKKKKKQSSHPRLSQRSPKRPLRERRQSEAMRTFWLWCIGIALIAGLFLYGLWRPEARITEVTAEGANVSGIESLARAKLDGTYYGVFPRDSFFFYPERSMREAILDEYPAVAAVSIGRSGLTSLSITTLPRVAALYWCGAPSSLSASDSSCYEADTEGLVFARATTLDAPGIPHVYAILDTEQSGERAPLRGRVQGADSLPDILRFVRDIERMGIPVASVAIRDDEADLFIAPATRLTYVIGKEEEARKNAEAAFPTLNLQDGSVEYVDLRFDGKVYLRRRE